MTAPYARAVIEARTKGVHHQDPKAAQIGRDDRHQYDRARLEITRVDVILARLE